MNEITNLIENIKARWNDQTTYSEYDLIKILSLMHERMIEMDYDLQHHNHHNGKPVTVNLLEIDEITRLENEIAELKKKQSPLLFAANAILREENARLRERLTEFENMARNFVNYDAPDYHCRMHFEMMLKDNKDKESEVTK